MNSKVQLDRKEFKALNALNAITRVDDIRRTPNGRHNVKSEVLKIMELLIQAGADIDAIDRNGTPLMQAARITNRDRVELLLKHDADPTIAVEIDGQILNAADMANRKYFGESQEIQQMIQQAINKKHQQELDAIVDAPADENNITTL